MCVDEVDLRVLGQEGLHDLLAFVTGELAGLRGKLLELGLGAKDVVPAFGAVDGRVGTGGAFEDDVVDLGGVSEFGLGPVSGLLAFEDEIRADEGLVQAGIGVNATVGQDDRDAGSLGLFEDCVPAGGDDGGEGDDVDLLGDGGLDGRDLLGLILLGRGEGQFDAELVGDVLVVGGVGGTPSTLRTNLRERDLRALQDGQIGFGQFAVGPGFAGGCGGLASC